MIKKIIYFLLISLTTITLFFGSCTNSSNTNDNSTKFLSLDFLRKSVQIMINDEKTLFLVIDHSKHWNIKDLCLYKYKNNLNVGFQKIESEVDSINKKVIYLSAGKEIKPEILFDENYIIKKYDRINYLESQTIGNFLITKILLMENDKIKLIGYRSINAFASLTNIGYNNFNIKDSIIENINFLKFNYRYKKLSKRKYDKQNKIIIDEIYLIEKSEVLDSLYLQIISKNNFIKGHNTN